MHLRSLLPALLLALALSGCGDDDEPTSSGSDESSESTADPRMEQAEAILDCTTGQDLPGTIGVIDGGIPAIDLTTEYETILVHVLESVEVAAGYENDVLDQELVENTAILGGAISPEHRATIVQCIEDNPIS
jgi:hypothetical protein